MSKGIAASISEMDIPLSQQLVVLREASSKASCISHLRRWGAKHLELEESILDQWVSKAWWGLAAGEVLRNHLYNENKRSKALDLIDPVDWNIIEEARKRGGVILATAHIGPPKVLMNLLIEQQMPLLVWTNTDDMPSWLPKKFSTRFLNPLIVSERSLLLIESALHLRKGGVIYGAPDWPSGSQRLSLHRFGLEWQFSRGLPTLARKLKLPTILLMALWEGNRIRISTTIMEDDYISNQENRKSEANAQDSSAFDQIWLDRYWAEVEKIIITSPENLRFLRGADDGMLLQELGL